MESERQGSKRLRVGWPVVRVQAVLVRTTLMRKAKSIGRLANKPSLCVFASSRSSEPALHLHMSPLHHYHHLALRRLDNSLTKSTLANGCFGSFLRASAYQTATAATSRLCTTRVSTNFAQVEYGRLPVTRAEPNAEICFVVEPSRKLLHIAAYIYALHVQYNGTSTLSDAISDMSPSPTSPYSCPLGTLVLKPCRFITELTSKTFQKSELVSLEYESLSPYLLPFFLLWKGRTL